MVGCDNCSKFAWKSMVCLLSCSFLFGYSFASLNTIANHVIVFLNVCQKNGHFTCDHAQRRIGDAAGSTFLGAAFSPLVAGWILTKYGRQNALRATLFFYGIGGILGFVTTSFSLLWVSRFFLGIGIGFTGATVPLFISELSRVDNRGQRGAWHRILVVTGMLSSQITTLFLPPLNSENLKRWTTFERFLVRNALGLPAFIVGYCVPLLFYFKEDSPAHYLASDDEHSASAVLQKIYKKEQIEAEMKQLKECAVNKQAAAEGRVRFVRRLWDHLRNSDVRLIFIVSLSLSLGYRLCGIIVFLSLSTALFIAVGLSLRVSNIATQIMFVLNWLGALSAIITIDFLGRRRLLLIGLTVQSVMFSCAAIALIVPIDNLLVGGYVTMVAALISVFAFSAGFGAVFWVYLPEILPSNLSGFAMGVFSTLLWLMSFLTVTFANAIIAEKRFGLLFSLFAVLNLLILTFVFIFILETKGVSRSPYLRDVSEGSSVEFAITEFEGSIM